MLPKPHLVVTSADSDRREDRLGLGAFAAEIEMRVCLRPFVERVDLTVHDHIHEGVL